MGAEKTEAGRSVRRLCDNPDMMGAHTEREAVEAEDSRVESFVQGTVPPVWSLASNSNGAVLFLCLHS